MKPNILLFGVAVVVAYPATARDRGTSLERDGTEMCVWETVQQRLRSGAAPTDVDAQLEIGRYAADKCKIFIRKWAESSPAVRDAGESIEDVEDRMRLHYSARGALFASGKAKAYYLPGAGAAEPPADNGLARTTPKSKPTNRVNSNAANQ